jgi:HK97 family phage major capsid protein
MDRFQILKTPCVKAHSASMSFEDFQRKAEEKRQEAAERRLTPQQRQSNELIRHQLSTSQGRQQLSNTLSNSIQRQLDFNSLARHAFRVDPLLTGSLPIYEIGNSSASINEQGNVIPTTESRTRLHVPLFEITSNPEIPLSQIRNGGFDLIDRIQTMAARSIANRESLLCNNILNAAVTTNTDQIIRPSESNSPESILNNFRDAFASIERSEIRVANILLNPSDYSILRNILGGNLDQTTHDELRESGLMGSLWGAQVITNPNITHGEIFVTSEPEHLGVMPIRSDITTLSADDPNRAMMGWSIFEEVGMACVNTNAVTRISLRNNNPPPVYGESIIQKAMPMLNRLNRFQMLKMA